MEPLVAVHGGVGAPGAWNDGCARAVAAALAALARGDAALDAAVAAVMVLEDDGRFNAGAGSSLRLDGLTVQMDASVMDHTGRFGAVALVEFPRHPVLLARRVMESPHHVLAAEGADALARRLGLDPHPGPSLHSRERYEKVCKAFRSRDPQELPAAWRSGDWQAYWNFDEPVERLLGTDTVGAVVRDASGACAVALSTGGSSPMLRGRIGDVPLIGCGFFAGPAGAVATTGNGEAIMEQLLAKVVYDDMARGAVCQAACEAGVARYPETVAIGVIAVGAGLGVAHNRDMAFGRNDGGS